MGGGLGGFPPFLKISVFFFRTFPTICVFFEACWKKGPKSICLPVFFSESARLCNPPPKKNVGGSDFGGGSPLFKFPSFPNVSDISIFIQELGLFFETLLKKGTNPLYVPMPFSFSGVCFFSFSLFGFFFGICPSL